MPGNMRNLEHLETSLVLAGSLVPSPPLPLSLQGGSENWATKKTINRAGWPLQAVVYSHGTTSACFFMRSGRGKDAFSATGNWAHSPLLCMTVPGILNWIVLVHAGVQNHLMTRGCACAHGKTPDPLKGSWLMPLMPGGTSAPTPGLCASSSSVK